MSEIEEFKIEGILPEKKYFSISKGENISIPMEKIIIDKNNIEELIENNDLGLIVNHIVEKAVGEIIDNMNNVPLNNQLIKDIHNNLAEIKTNTTTIDNKISEDISTTNLKQIYEDNKEEFEDWLLNGKKFKKKSLRTRKDHIRRTQRIFTNNIKTVYDFNKLRDENPKAFLSRPNVNFRGFIKFCMDRGKLKDDIGFSILSKVEGKVNSNKNDKVPTEDEVVTSIKSMRKFYKNKPHCYLLYELFIESGGRWEGAIQKMLLKFDESRLTSDDNIAIYDINYDIDENDNIVPITDKTKLSFFLFMRKQTFEEVMKYKNIILKKTFVNNYKKNVSRDNTSNKLQNFVTYSAVRKFARTKMVKSGVSSEFADFIESRVDGKGGTIGFSIYQDKNEALEEYKKFIPYLEKLLN